MNILLINHYAGSSEHGMEFRPFYLAREWVKKGHNVYIIGASYSHLRYKQPPTDKEYQVIDGVNFFWIKTPTYNGTIARIINILCFVFKLVISVKKISKKINPDVVIASSTYPLDVFPAKLISKNSKAKLCYEVHDLWPLSPMIIGGYSKWHPYIIIMQYAENYALKKSDSVVSLLRNAKEYMVDHGLAENKFCCIPNGIDYDGWKGKQFDIPLEHKELLLSLKQKGKTIVGYAGGHTVSTSLATIIQAANQLNSKNDIVFVLVGDGVSKENLILYSLSLGNKNIYFLPPVQKGSIPTLVGYFDIAYMGGVHSILHKYGTSFNKMSDYMLSAKPIVAAIDEPESIIQKVGCGIVVEAENSDYVADAILNLVDAGAEIRVNIGEKGRNYAINELKYSKLAEDMLTFIIRS